MALFDEIAVPAVKSLIITSLTSKSTFVLNEALSPALVPAESNVFFNIIFFQPEPALTVIFVPVSSILPVLEFLNVTLSEPLFTLTQADNSYV